MAREKRARGILEKAADVFDLPGQVVVGLTRVTITGDRRIHIENHRGILEYGEEEIHVSCGRMVLKMKGKDLVLKAMSDTEIMITGALDAVEFIR